MCHSCYERYTDGEEPDVTSVMRLAKRMVEEIYRLPNCGAGGPLHVIIDDMNVDDRLFEKPLSFKWYEDMTAEDRLTCLITFDILKELSVPERAWVTFYADSSGV